MAYVVEATGITTGVVAKRLQGEGWRALAPMYEREVRHARRIEYRQAPLFGRYLFGWFEPDELGRVLRVRGVAGVLRKAGSREPSYLNDAVIRGIQTTVADAEFELGEEVVVCGGKMDGFKGLFSRSVERRVYLMISMLGAEFEMDFDKRDVMRNPIQEKTG